VHDAAYAGVDDSDAVAVSRSAVPRHIRRLRAAHDTRPTDSLRFIASSLVSRSSTVAKRWLGSNPGRSPATPS
jgi:hypothetical protein